MTPHDALIAAARELVLRDPWAHLILAEMSRDGAIMTRSVSAGEILLDLGRPDTIGLVWNVHAAAPLRWWP